ncbi:MAG: sigma-70 family RNA polymerase sigma factor [Propionibacteriaceae bacterium]|nr:sigma-70 family RNA polymerase sigma factor [Propionibacteriaceae bacterium]
MPTGIDTTTIVERYQTMVYAIALTHSPTRNDADDVFQEVFLTYHRKNPPCEHEDHRKAWLITTTLNIARRVAGSSWSTKVVPVDASDLGDSSYRFDNHEYDELFTALRSIPHEYRTVIHLFYFEDQSVDEIAGVLDAKPGAIKMRLSRGRTMLREVLSKEKDHG